MKNLFEDILEGLTKSTLEGIGQSVWIWLIIIAVLAFGLGALLF